MGEKQETERRKNDIVIVTVRHRDKSNEEERKQDDLASAQSLLEKQTEVYEDELINPVGQVKGGGEARQECSV
ncbi:hypothetical protein PoB_000922200 [Plakobranchus ocellatus]|uniref:Uncharacterized protein n=1 Tax=Plakobranchus ocellatus TaxID=259542 RepID=A0AAV3YKM7_9GAST|nr:hypothetical protein PoB_000922200 [Plakobranchus ocellatus]